MKWFLLVFVFYTSFWGFLGWGIKGSIGCLMALLTSFLIATLIVVFNFKEKLVKEALMLLYVPCMIVYAIVSNLDAMSTWKIVFIIIAFLIQSILIYFYFKAKRKKEA